MAKHATGNTTGFGIIPYGSTDESVLFQDPLTSTPSNGVMIGTGVTFDSDGMDTNGTGAWRFDLSALGFNTLERAGQISFDILSEYIATPESYASYNHTGSSGTPPDTINDYILSWSSATDTSGVSGRFFTSVDNTVNLQMEWGDTTFIPIVNRYTNHGKDAYCTITLSWSGTNVSIYVDGAPHYSFANGINLPADLMKYLIVGTYQNRTTADYLLSAGRKVKNLIVSNRPVMLAGHPMLSRLVVMGDSLGIAAGDESVASTNRFDHMPPYQAKAALALKGLRIGMPYTYPNGFLSTAVNGAMIDNTGSAAAKISDQATTALAYRPSIIYISGCTNDALRTSGFNAATSEAEYKSLLSTLLAPGTSVQKVFVGTVTSLKGAAVYQTNSALVNSQTDACNAFIKSLPAWWDANNPSDTGRVVVVDLFTAFGGHSAPDINFIGTWNANHPNYLNDVHPSSAGGRIMGREIGRAIWENL